MSQTCDSGKDKRLPQEGCEMSKVLKKTVRARKRQIQNLYAVVGSWRKMAAEYYGGQVKHGTLQRFATDADYVPTDETLLQLLDLIVPPNPYRILPRWYKRIPEALEYFNGKRSQIAAMSAATKARTV